MHHLRRDERGFAMMTTVVMMVACAMLALAAYTAASGDQPVSRQDSGRKQALQAAQAGVAWYAAKLKADPDYWLKCDAVGSPGGGINPLSATPRRPGQPDTRRFRPVAPGSSLSFTIELLPVSGPSCSTSNAAGTMLGSGSQLRVRVTGQAAGLSPERRTLVATFRRPSFLDYVYYTDFEVTDPDADADGATSSVAGQSDNCARYYRLNRPAACHEIQWGANDYVLGPLHTNDELNLCGSPTFGRAGRTDAIEVSDPDGYRTSCASSPTWNGLKVFGAEPVAMPSTDASLGLIPNVASYSGNTQIQLVKNGYFYRTAATYMADLYAGRSSGRWYGLGDQPGASQPKPYPSSKLIWVKDGSGSCAPTTIYSRYDFSDYNCGNAYVSGTYGSDVTIAAENDVVITGDLKRSGTSELLGLIGENYVRVFHPVSFDGNATTCDTSRPNAADTNPSLKVLADGSSLRVPFTNPDIQAGILAVNHSFIVDNYACGTPVGTLKVTGAIAQRYRGPVALVNGSNQTQLTGYTKNYLYDDQFAYREPPNFLDPVKAAWRSSRVVEQVPAS